MNIYPKGIPRLIACALLTITTPCWGGKNESLYLSDEALFVNEPWVEKTHRYDFYSKYFLLKKFSKKKDSREQFREDAKTTIIEGEQQRNQILDAINYYHQTFLNMIRQLGKNDKKVENNWHAYYMDTLNKLATKSNGIDEFKVFFTVIYSIFSEKINECSGDPSLGIGTKVLLLELYNMGCDYDLFAPQTHISYFKHTLYNTPVPTLD